MRGLLSDALGGAATIFDRPGYWNTTGRIHSTNVTSASLPPVDSMAKGGEMGRSAGRDIQWRLTYTHPTCPCALRREYPSANWRSAC